MDRPAESVALRLEKSVPSRTTWSFMPICLTFPLLRGRSCVGEPDRNAIPLCIYWSVTNISLVFRELPVEIRAEESSMPISVPLIKERVVLGVTGASGSIYAELLLEILLAAGVRTYLVATETARKVMATELPETSLMSQVLACGLQARFEMHEGVLRAAAARELQADALSQLKVFSNDDFYAPIASGSEGATHMVVAPCSMGTMARIAHGMSTCLLERCADVMLKEKRTLVISPRETPLSTIHLQNMLILAQAGAAIVPAMPAFYNRPQSVEEVALFVVERLLDQLKLSAPLREKTVRWNIRRL